MSSVEADEWDAVHTVHDFYGRPLKGTADYKGFPHAYMREWDLDQDDWADTLLLSPISDEQMSAVKEQWHLWLRWRSAQDDGTLQPEDHHPTLAKDRKRYEQLATVVEAALKVDDAKSIRVKADFRGDILSMGKTAVRWTEPDDSGTPPISAIPHL
ncbi:hypothetical protein [Mesorhizobium sp. URHB0026]